jgi:hypothetical protein
MKLPLINLLNASLFNTLLAEPPSYLTPGKKLTPVINPCLNNVFLNKKYDCLIKKYQRLRIQKD